MRRLGSGLLLVGLVVSAHAAPPPGVFVSEPDILTIWSEHSNTVQLPSYPFSSSVELTQTADTTPIVVTPPRQSREYSDCCPLKGERSQSMKTSLPVSQIHESETKRQKQKYDFSFLVQDMSYDKVSHPQNSSFYCHPCRTERTPNFLGFGSTSRLPSVANPKTKTRWTLTARRPLISIASDGRALLSPLLLNESKGESLEIKPRRHSILIMWRKSFP